MRRGQRTFQPDNKEDRHILVSADAVEWVAAQTEGDTGYDYNDIYDEDYEEESGKRIRRLRAIKVFLSRRIFISNSALAYAA